MKKRLARVDYFKWIAAMLVAANHTSPLESVNETADFLLTRVVARLAVPFFFMVTGYFVLAGDDGKEEQKSRIMKSLKKTGALYMAVTVFYLPVQLYRFLGEIRQIHTGSAGEITELLKRIGKAVFWEGTYYHLWYFPAVMLGLLITAFLLKYLPKQASVITLILYFIGLAGDSYYGFTAGIPLLKNMYAGLFSLFSQTRNGFFMAPVFLLAGRNIAVRKAGKAKEPPKKEEERCFRKFLITLLFMCLEGVILWKGNIQRHDSMYLILPVCMWYLFSYLTKETETVRREEFFYKGPMIFYLVHPAGILAVRAFAKITKLKAVLSVSPLYYSAVVFSSLAAAWLILWCGKYVKRTWKGR